MNAINAPTIYVKNAYLRFKNKTLFQDLNLTLLGGKLTCLLGTSGVGKTTLLRLIAHLYTPETLHQEEIYFEGDIHSNQELLLQHQISYMAQTDLLLPWLTVLDNVLLGSRLRRSNLHSERAHELLSHVGLGDALHLFPHELSGGMRQRVALVRTLMENKKVVLMDEPFSALDAITRYKLQTIASTLLRDHTVLLVTHDPFEALRLADEIYIMSGSPACLHSPLKLRGHTPRDLSSQEIINLQPLLFAELLKASEVNR